MAEQKKAPEREVMYIYDRICPKASKQREILREYGNDLKRSQPRSANSGPRQGSRPNPTPQNNPPRKQANPQGSKPKTQKSKPSSGGSNRSGSAYRGQANRGTAKRAYSSERIQRGYGKGLGSGFIGSYERSGGYNGAVAVKQMPLKLILDGIINFIDTVEERGRNDERIAKRRAIAAKKWSEYKHVIKTVFIMLLVLAMFVAMVYRLVFVVREINVDGTAVYGAEQIVDVSGIAQGDTLYSFSSGDVYESITFHCPYIRSVEVNRTIPNKVSITLTDDTAVYYANVWGDWLLLSSGLRVLEVVTEAEAISRGLSELVIPEVNYSVTGGTIGFADSKCERFIRSALGEIEKSQLGRTGFIDRIDLTNEYDIVIEYDTKYVMNFGGEGDLDMKLLMAYKTITSDKFEKGTPAKINLETVGEASVRYDHSVVTNQ